MAIWNLFEKGITKRDDKKFATVHTLSSFMPDVIFCERTRKHNLEREKGSSKNKDKMNFHNRNWNSCKTEDIRSVIGIPNRNSPVQI